VGQFASSIGSELVFRLPPAGSLLQNTKRHYLRFHMQRRREVQCPGCTISFANNQTKYKSLSFFRVLSCQLTPVVGPSWSLHVNSCIVLSEKQDPAASLRQWDDQDKKFDLLVSSFPPLKLGFQAELNCDYLGYYHSQERASGKSSFVAAIFRPTQRRPQ